jgi:soluble lytic murein transglycosylase-like protein
MMQRFGLILIAMASMSGLQQTAWSQSALPPDPELLRRLKEVANEADSFPDHFAAQVWLTDMSARLARQVTDPEERLAILKRVHYEATRRDLAPELVLAVIDVESNFDRFAISVAGAQGLMLVMPFWLVEIGKPDDNLMHINTNVRFGCTILKYYMDMENNDLRRALGRYNGSLGKRAYPNKVLDKLRKKWFRA